MGAPGAALPSRIASRLAAPRAHRLCDMATAPRKLPVPAPVCLLLLLASTAAATQFSVGDSMGWRVPVSGAESYNQWAERSRFQKGDSLLFVYPSGQDSVLQVSKSDYDGCNTGSPAARFTGGSTTFQFDRTGEFWFISGVEDNCKKGEKLDVVVLAERGGNQPATPSSATPSSATPSSPTPPSAAPAKVVGAVGAALGSLAVFAL